LGIPLASGLGFDFPQIQGLAPFRLEGTRHPLKLKHALGPAMVGKLERLSGD
jgi:hypothetical protein